MSAMPGLMQEEKSDMKEEHYQLIPIPYYALSADENLQRKLDCAAISEHTRDDDRRDKTDGPSSSTPKDHLK